ILPDGPSLLKPVFPRFLLVHRQAAGGGCDGVFGIVWIRFSVSVGVKALPAYNVFGIGDIDLNAGEKRPFFIAFGCVMLPPNPGAGHKLSVSDRPRRADAKVSAKRGFNGVDRRKNRPRNPIFLAVFLIYRQILGRDDPFPFGRQDPFSVIKGLLHLHLLLSAAEHADQTSPNQEKEKGNRKEYKQ